jgi:hypothetical protein
MNAGADALGLLNNKGKEHEQPPNIYGDGWDRMVCLEIYLKSRR